MYGLTIVYAATNLQPVFTSGYTIIGVQNVWRQNTIIDKLVANKTDQLENGILFQI